MPEYRLPRLAAAGIGSLPHTDARAAVEVVRTHLPAVPHWPQLPRRGRAEHFVHQNLSLLVRLGLLKTEAGTAYLDAASPDWPAMLTDFYEIFLAAEAGDPAALAEFAPAPEAAAGLYALAEDLERRGTAGAAWLKGQVAGPLSVGLNLTDRERRLAYYDPQLRDLVVKTLAMHARWQAAYLGRFGLPVLVNVDEPAVGALGTATYITLSREAVLEDLQTLAGGILAAGALPGAHSCAAVDWTLFWQSGYRVLSLDAFYYFQSLIPYARELGAWLAEGGRLAWGLVPTTDAAWGENAGSLADRWEREIAELAARGIPEAHLRDGLVTPSCGTGILEPDLALHIYRLTSALAGLLQGRQNGR